MIHTEVIRPVAELLAARATPHGSRAAVSDAEATVSYARLQTRTAALGGALAGLGVRRGDRVLLLMANSVALVECYLAVVRAEGIGVCLNPASSPDEVAFVLADCQPRVVIADMERAELVAGCLGRSGPDPDRPLLVRAGDGEPAPGWRSLQELVEGRPAQAAPDGLPLDEPAWMLYTSGTTGRPKGVLLTQRGMLWVVASAWLPFLELTAEDTVLNPLPLSHSYPFDLLLATLAAGGRHHVMTRFSPARVLRELREQRASVLLCVPTTVSYLLNAARQADLPAPPFPALRMVITAGAVAAPALSERVERELGVPLIDAYGSTEASTAILLNSARGTRIPGSCGVPAPGWAVRIVDPVTSADLAPGEEGELIARGPGIMLGYYNRPDETAATLRDGWYRSGDLARQDRNGYVTISGRLKDVIIRGGENVTPAEIEQVALRHPGVADCAVAGRADEVLGEVPVLFVVPAAGATVRPEAVREWCADSLPPFKVPDEVRFLREIPKTASGKIKRHLLHAAGLGPTNR